MPTLPPPARPFAVSSDGLGTLERDLKQLEDQVGGVLDLGLGALRVGSGDMALRQIGTTVEVQT